MQMLSVNNQSNISFGLKPRIKAIKGYKDILKETANIIDGRTKDWNCGHMYTCRGDFIYDLELNKRGLTYRQHRTLIDCVDNDHKIWFDRKTANELLAQPAEKIANTLLKVMNIFRIHDEKSNITAGVIKNVRRMGLLANIKDVDGFSNDILSVINKHLNISGEIECDRFLSKAKMIFDRHLD